MIDVQFEAITEIIEELLTETKHWLQNYAGTTEEDFNLLLSNEMVQEMDITRLNYLFKSFEEIAPSVNIELYSVQSSKDVDRTYHVEVKLPDSEYTFKTPLHASLSPQHIETGEVASFYYYLFIQIAALQYAANLNVEVTPYYVNEVFKYCYGLLTKNEEFQEDLQVDDMNKLLRFNRGGMFSTEVEAEEREPEANDELDGKLFRDIDFDNVEMDEEDESDFFEIEEDDFFEDEVDDDDSGYFQDEEEAGLEIDFHALNGDLNDMFKLTEDLEQRQQIKNVKADIWEVEMKLEEGSLSIEDVQKLSYQLLSLTLAEKELLQLQLGAVRRLMASIVD